MPPEAAPTDLLARRTPRLRSRIVAVVIVAGWVALAAWSLDYVLSVLALRDDYSRTVAWIHRGEVARTRIEVAMAPRDERPADFEDEVRDVLLPLLDDPALLDSAPASASILSLARTEFDPAAERIRAALRADPAAQIDRRDGEAAAHALQSLTSDVRIAARQLTAEQNDAFATMYALTAVLLACAAGLGVVCSRYRTRSKQLTLARSEALDGRRQLESLVQTAQDLIWSTDTDGRLTFVNAMAGSIYGVPVSMLLGRRWCDLAPPENSKRDAAAFAELQRSDEPTDVETVHSRGDGRPIHLRFRGRALRDSAGRLSGATGTAADVTRLHEMQQRHMHAERIQAIGTLAGGIAHDFNNLLTAIVGFCDLARLDLDDRAACRRDLEELECAAMRGRSLTDQLLQFARKQPVNRGVRDLCEVLRGVERLARRVMPEEIELRFEVPKEPVFACVDRGRLEHVLLNLAVNARDAVRAGGSITFRLEEVESPPIAEDEAARAGALERAALISVVDDGTGMDGETLRRVFDPYFTTKPLGEGTGLGLSIAQGIVAQHEGLMRIRSNLGHGTVVSILLPLASTTEVEEGLDDYFLGQPPATEETKEIRSAKRVLVVEDDPSVLFVVCAGLRGAGFDVHTAESPAAAPALFETDERPFDLLVTDVRMPGASGPEIAAAARRRHPDLPVLFMSGYGGDVLDPDWLERPAVGFLEKPFAMERMIHQIESMLAPAAVA